MQPVESTTLEWMRWQTRKWRDEIEDKQKLLRDMEMVLAVLEAASDNPAGTGDDDAPAPSAPSPATAALPAPTPDQITAVRDSLLGVTQPAQADGRPSDPPTTPLTATARPASPAPSAAAPAMPPPATPSRNGTDTGQGVAPWRS